MPDIFFLERVARECGSVVRRLSAGDLTATDKAEQLGAHFVLNADKESQARGLRMFRVAFPDEILIAEEQENQSDVPPDCTVFDPLDGTTLQFNGGHHSGVTLCTFRNGRPVVGVMYWMSDDVMISAVQGQGCWWGGFKKGRQIHIPPWHGKIDKIVVATDVGPWTPHEVLRPIADKHNVVSYMVGIYGARVILEGIAPFYFNFNIAKIWDGAAGSLAVQEAGGVALSPSGEPLRWNLINLDWFYARDKAMAEYALPYFKAWSPRR